MSKTFTIEPHDGADKQFRILSNQIDLIVDYDDVDHKVVDRLARKVAKILNEHWDKQNG